MSRRPSSTSVGGGLYTQFCIGVELGDDTLVRDLIVRGANTMVSYAVDGKITTPMRSALSKGDMPMALALLTSRSTRVKLADLAEAPKVKRDLVTSVLTQRIGDSLVDEDRRTLLLQKIPENLPRSRGKISLLESVASHLHNAPTDSSLIPYNKNMKERCFSPSRESSESPSEAEEEEDASSQSVKSSIESEISEVD